MALYKGNSGWKMFAVVAVGLMIAVFAVWCSGCASFQKMDDSRIVHPASGEKSVWTIIQTQSDEVRTFWPGLYSYPNNFVMFGEAWCSPCVAVEYDADDHPLAGWKYWHVALPHDPTSEQRLWFDKFFLDFWLTAVGEKTPTAYPLIVVVQDAAPGRPLKDVVKASFLDAFGYERFVKWANTPKAVEPSPSRPKPSQGNEADFTCRAPTEPEAIIPASQLFLKKNRVFSGAPSDPTQIQWWICTEKETVLQDGRRDRSRCQICTRKK